jgi:quercetin dioxygenase-like cupin family protein
MLVELAPQVNTGLHTHPGFDAAYLVEGDLTVLERGQPGKPIHAGQSWHVCPGVVHEVKAGDRGTKVLAMLRRGERQAVGYAVAAATVKLTRSFPMWGDARSRVQEH